MTRELITKCAGPKPEWRTLKRMSSIIRRADGAIKEALPRLGDDAVKTRAGDMDEEYLIEGDPDELLIRAGLLDQRLPQLLRREQAALEGQMADRDSDGVCRGVAHLASIITRGPVEVPKKLARRGVGNLSHVNRGRL